MSRDITADFVDRKEELAQFLRMLSGETGERFLLILEPGEKGKSYFLQRLFHECRQQRPPAPVVLLDFDQQKSNLIDYLNVARAIRRQLGDARTPAICACEDAIFHHTSPVSVQTGAGGAGVDFGRRGDFTQAEVAGITGRDHVSVHIESISISEPTPTAERIAHYSALMGRALRADLASLSQTQPVVLLVDTFEQALKRQEVRIWLEHWLFAPACFDLPRVHLVVAGRPECQSFFEPPPLWSSLVTHVCFHLFSDKDILAYYRQRGLTVSEADIAFLQVARLNPARMADLGRLLEQAQGGTR